PRQGTHCWSASAMAQEVARHVRDVNGRLYVNREEWRRVHVQGPASAGSATQGRPDGPLRDFENSLALDQNLAAADQLIPLGLEDPEGGTSRLNLDSAHQRSLSNGCRARHRGSPRALSTVATILARSARLFGQA